MNPLVELLDRWTSRIKLRPRLLMTFYFISIVPLVITAAFFYLTLTQSLEEEVGASMVQTTRQVDERLLAFTEETTHIIKIIQSNSNTQAFLNWDDSSDLSIIPELQSLRNLITTVANQRTSIRGVYVVNDYGKFMYTSQDMAKMSFEFLKDPWYQEVAQIKNFRLLPEHEQHYAQGASVVTFAGRMFKVSDLEESGTLLLDFDSQYLSNMIEPIRVGKTGSVYMITETGESAVHMNAEDEDIVQSVYSLPEFKQDQGYLLTKINQVQMLVGFSTSKATGWKIVAVVPFHEVSGKIEGLRWAIFVLVCIAIVFILILAKYLSQTLTRPMRRLANYMKQVEQGDLTVRVPMDRGDEFGLLASRFNIMLEKVQELEEVVYLSEIRETKLQLLSRESELKALQMQINPHFLHNTLNTMKCIGEVYDVEEVTLMSEGLAEMFRYSIDSDKYKTLREEIDHVQAYIQIIQVRYPERIQCHVDIPQSLEDRLVLKLILQPIVENAIEHGLIPKASKGNIWIKAESSSDQRSLVLKVTNDGLGITAARLREIKEKLELGRQVNQADHQKLLAGHVGLFNVSQRLALNYGDQGRLSIDYNTQSGTVVELRLPLGGEEEDDADA